jgi:hypothetical protein
LAPRVADAAPAPPPLRLRALLAACPEWNDGAARARLAAGAPSCAGLPELLAAKNCADMRKAHMLHLAHAWRYKSDCWSARAPPGGGGGGGAEGADAAGAAAPSRKRVAAAPSADAAAATAAAPARCSARRRRAPSPPSAAPPLPLLLLHDRTFTTLGVARGAALARVAPLMTQACAGWEARASAAAFGAAGDVGMSWARLRAVQGAIDVCDCYAAFLDLRLAALRAWRDTLDEEALRAPAYSSEATYATPDCELDAHRCAFFSAMRFFGGVCCVRLLARRFCAYRRRLCAAVRV